MEPGDTNISPLTFELEDDSLVHKLLKELIAAKYRISYDRFVWDGEGSADDLEEQERSYEIIENAQFLDWRRDHPAGRSTILLSPGTLEVRLPAPMPDEDITEFLRRLIGILKSAPSEKIVGQGS